MKRIILTAAILILSLTATGQDCKKVPGVHGYVYDVDGNPVPVGVRVNIIAKSFNVDGSLNYTELRATLTKTHPTSLVSNFYNLTEPATPSGNESMNNIIGVAGYMGYQIGVDIRRYVAGTWPFSPLQMGISMGYASNIILDVGNDTLSPWEWEDTPLPFKNKQVQANLNPVKINTILRNNCQCRGCILNETTNECIIPLVFSSDTPGKITVDDIYIEYERLKVIDSVDYNKSFPISEGADWTVDVSLAAPYTPPIPQDYAGGDLQSYTPAGVGCGRTVGIERDAVDDAMWRLLNRIDSRDDFPNNCQLNNIQLPDGGFTPFNSSTMFFRIRRYSVTPELWGPALVKLIVWI